jgi:hypothetical protein
MTFQTQVCDVIKEYYFIKCQGTQDYSDIVNGSMVTLNSTTYYNDGFDPEKGFVRELSIGFDIQVDGPVSVNITNIPYNHEEKFFTQLSQYICGLIDCFYSEPIEYNDLVRDYCQILSEFSAINQESEYGYDYDPELQLNFYNSVMAIIAIPEPTEAEVYLAMVENPLAGLTQEKSWYRRQDPKKQPKVVRRTKSKNQARKLKQRVFSFEPLFDVMDTLEVPEYDDYAY